MDPQGDGTYELVLKQDPSLRWIRTVSHTMPHDAVWHSSDLYRPHPENPQLWRFDGRIDDVVVLSNGEKFNPVSMEAVVQGDPLLNGALYSGYGKFQPALLAEPKNEVVPDSISSFIDQIWPSIEKANEIAPQHAQIFRHKIAIGTPSKPFKRAAKGTVIRKLTLQEYHDELEALYSEESNTKSKAVSTLEEPQSIEAVTDYVRDTLNTVIGNVTISDDQDLFSFGLDSLQTLELIRKLKAGLRGHLSADVLESLTSKAAYDHSSVKAISALLYSMLHECGTGSWDLNNGVGGREVLMENMVSRYTEGLARKQGLEVDEERPVKYQRRSSGRSRPKLSNASSTANGVQSEDFLSRPTSVAVTGTTGSIGTYLLLQLLKDQKVKKIYCLNRGDDAKERQAKSFAVADAGQYTNSKKLVFLKSVLHHDRLGLKSKQWLDLLNNTGIILHTAWKVDFNHKLKSFEEQLAGVRKLVDFCRQSSRRPHFLFVSSVAAVGNWSALNPGGGLVPELPPKNNCEAQNQGYGESKHVAERVLQVAACTCNVPVSILRLGQIAGPVESSGIWNVKEWVPALIRTSKQLQLVPNELPEVNWVPVDIVARVIVEVLHSAPPDSIEVMNIVNPYPVEWKSLVPAVQGWFENENIQAVPLRDWIKAVQSVDLNDARQVDAAPAAKILDFFVAIAESDQAQASYMTRVGMEKSKSMAQLKAVSPEWMRTWLEQWSF